MDIESNRSLLELPDLVLHQICSSITCPFDLLHFGNTCSRLRRVSSAPSLWWHMSFRWLRGLWILMEEGSIEVNSRDWLLDIMRQYCAKSTRTLPLCQFSDGESWRRSDTPRFRFLFNLLRVAYAKDREDNPAVLYEQWLYDMGLYQRSNVTSANYKSPIFEISPEEVLQLSSLGQAAERDLCRRKQPFKDPRYYVRFVATDLWMDQLFPVSLNGSICPLLMCPFSNSYHSEVSGMQGLAICFSFVFEKRLRSTCKSSSIPLYRVWEVVKIICSVFVSEIFAVFRMFQEDLKNTNLKTSLNIILAENLYSFPQVQMIIDKVELHFSAKDILNDLRLLLDRLQGIDFVVDDVRMFLRNAMNEEIQKVLFPKSEKSVDEQLQENLIPSSEVVSPVTRINLTDSDLIGGDNCKQEMSSAAFVTDHGVLVTWHLTGRMRY